MIWLYTITIVALIVSFIVDRQKSKTALRMALKKFLKILPALVVMVVLVSIVLCMISDDTIMKYLNDDNRYVASLLASLLGSISVMPGFIAFPLCGVLKGQGVPYMVLSAFSTTLMMVGMVSYPIEKEYLGRKVAILRNLISFCIALIIAVVTGIVFGEVF